PSFPTLRSSDLPSDVVGASVSDTIPGELTAVTWTCAASAGSSCAASGSGDITDTVNLLAGGTATYTVHATVKSSATGSVSNTASVTAPAGVTDAAGNNTDTDTDTITLRSDLSITKTDGVTSVDAGTSTTYTIVVKNNGPSDVVGASVSDTIPGELTAVTWTCAASAGSSCAASGSGDITDTVNLLAGGTATYTVHATVKSSATGSVSNTASVTAPAGVTDAAGNNTDTDTDTITLRSDLSITKTDGVTSVDAGTSTTYTIVVKNNGPSDVVGASVSDTIPGELTAVTWTCAASAGSSCAASGSGDITDTVNLLAGGTATYTVHATVK